MASSKAQSVARAPPRECPVTWTFHTPGSVEEEEEEEDEEGADPADGLLRPSFDVRTSSSLTTCGHIASRSRGGAGGHALCSAEDASHCGEEL